MKEEFYIGWEAKAAPGIGKTARNAAFGLLLFASLAAAALAVSQRMVGTSVFEWGTHKTFSGLFVAQPYPCLLVPRPGNTSRQQRFSTYCLVAQWKFGLDPATVAQFDGHPVTLQGTLIYRDNQTMIEVVDHSIHLTNSAALPPAGQESVPLGRQTFVGEIVDSKCFFGVMNPGQLAPHRACAIRCLSGGCPPVFLVRQRTGPPLCLLLVSADGKPVNQQVLGLVAEPVEITGDVERQGELLILRADPKTYRKL
jgi:hypothetical protein